MDDEISFEKKETTCAKEATLMKEEIPSQSSYLLLSQETSSPQKSKAELEKVALAQPPAPAPGDQSLPTKPTEVVAEKKSGATRMFQLPSLKMETGKRKPSQFSMVTILIIIFEFSPASPPPLLQLDPRSTTSASLLSSHLHRINFDLTITFNLVWPSHYVASFI